MSLTLSSAGLDQLSRAISLLTTPLDLGGVDGRHLAADRPLDGAYYDQYAAPGSAREPHLASIPTGSAGNGRRDAAA